MPFITRALRHMGQGSQLVKVREEYMPVIELEKAPIPVPSSVLLSEIVGVEFVLLQQTPREVIVAAPSDAILPPHVAVVWVIDDKVFVVIPVAVVAANVVNEIFSP